MNKLFAIIAAFATILSVAGCSEKDDKCDAGGPVKADRYLVTPDRAIARLKEVMGDKITRLASVSSVKTIGRNAFMPHNTRAADAADAPALYIVDLPETGGCAVLAADTRLDPIYAILDNTKLEVEDLLQTPRSASDDEDITAYVGGLINRAVGAVVRDSLREPVPDDPRVPAAKGWDETTVVARQEPLLKTKWNQWSPFNDNCPMEAKDSSGNPTKSPAGCVTIALAQIMYYNRLPASIGGITFDLNLIRKFEGPYYNLPFYNLSARMEIANYIYTIATALPVDFNNMTGAKNSQAISLLSRSGYHDVHTVDYGIGAVRQMVATRKMPVYISGSDSEIKNSGHAWVIDGCNCYKVDSWLRTFSGSAPVYDYTDTLVYSKEYNLVHCNYGWGGSCDGYYSSGIFDTTSMLSGENRDESIGDVQYVQPYDFDTNLKLILYTL